MPTKNEYQHFLKTKLSTNDRWALRALVVIYAKQTSDEQQIERTKYHNNVGFTGTDSELLSSFAKQYLIRHFLSSKQLVHLKKMIPKYWQQILEDSDRAKLDVQVEKEKQIATAQLNLNLTTATV